MWQHACEAVHMHVSSPRSLHKGRPNVSGGTHAHSIVTLLCKRQIEDPSIYCSDINSDSYVHFVAIPAQVETTTVCSGAHGCQLVLRPITA